MDIQAVKLLLEDQRQQTKLLLQEQRAESEKREALLLEALKQNRQNNVILKHENDEDQQQIQLRGSKAETIRNLRELIDKFEYDPDHNGTFEKWFERYDGIFTTTEELDDREKRILLLQCLQQTDFNYYRDSIRPRKPDEVAFDKTIEELTRLFSFRETKFSLRTKCFKLTIEDSEDYAKYAARINYNAERFDVTSCTADDLKVLFFLNGLCGTKHEKMLEKLLIKVDQTAATYEALKTQAERDGFKKLNLQDLVNTAERLISVQKDKQIVSSAHESTIINSVNYQNKKSRSNNTKQHLTTSAPNVQRPTIPKSPCWGCGEMHWNNECPQKDRKTPFERPRCSICNKLGHWSKDCHQRYQGGPRIFRRNSDPELHHSSKHISAKASQNRKFVETNINGSSIKLQLDTGSDITIISQENWRLLGKPMLQPTSNVGSASGDSFSLKGFFPCVMKLGGVEEFGEVYVANHKLNLFGADWIHIFKLWDTAPSAYCNSVRVNDNSSQSLMATVKTKFPKVFAEGLGCYTKSTSSVTLNQGAQPVYRKARPVPHSALPDVTAELERLQHLGIITPTTYSEWAAPIVVIKKKTGKLRICGDYSTGLNDAIESHHHPIPTTDQIFSNLAGCTKFSKIDLTDAFWQIPVDADAQKILTINTHMGLYNVNRLQQGVKTAPGIFQQIVDTMCSGINAFPFIDDIIIGGTDETHDSQLFKLLSRIGEFGFKIRPEKCEFGVKQVEFCGHIISDKEIKPSPDKLVKTKDLPPPADIHQLRSFLGAVNYYGKFIHELKTLRAPLDKLLEKDVAFEWTSVRQQAFEDIKQVLSSDLVLTHYDPKKKIVLATDASQYGMGAVLMHEFADGTLHPIMHWSSTFNNAERNYPQIQKEARALVFGLKKSYSYTYGRKIEIHIDHKPLLAIFGSKKGIPVYTASRLARYALVVMTFDFTIKYINTDSFGYADIVSRLIAQHPKSNEDTVIAAVKAANEDYEDDSVISTIREQDPIILNLSTRTDPINFNDVQQATQECQILQQVTKFIETKWPQKQRQIHDKKVAEFFNVRNYLTTQQGCVFFNERLVIPTRLQQKIIQELHEGHPGGSRMKLLAQSFVYFPYIDELIEKFVRSCEACATTAKAPVKCSLQPWPIPHSPWSRLHIDYAGPIDGDYFLIIVDAFSKWPEIFKTKVTTSSRTIELISEALTRQGHCDTIVSDNGPQFASAEFDQFCKAQGIRHIKTAPYSPQSNGQAERFVDTFKRSIKKLSGNIDQKLREFLSNYRRTPSYNLGRQSPAELLNNRTMKSRLHLLKPTLNNQSQTNSRSKQSKSQFDRHHGAKWREFKEGDDVYYQQHLSTNKWQWTPATIIERLGEVNYKIKISSDRTLKAHTSQLKFRFSRNEFLDEFDLDDDFSAAPIGQIEPIVTPKPFTPPINQDPESGDESFQDASDFQDVPSPVQQANQRPKRVTAGVPPLRYYDEFNI